MLLNSRFIVEQQVGTGGMGTVFRARDTATGKLVAVKLLQPQSDPQDAERFAREAELLAEIDDPRVVSYVAHGVSEQGQPYLVMDWLEGEDLEQHLRQHLPSIAECVSLLESTSAALAEAHARGIIHRDLKPSNLFLRNGRMEDVVVVDFGLARRALRGDPLTRAGVILGTPGYMAPEQVRGEQDVGVAADIFSLGCVLYECLTGHAPFLSEHLMSVLVKVLIVDPTSVRALRPGVPIRLAALVMRMLDKEPERRFDGGLALHTALRELDLKPDELMEGSIPTSAEAVLWASPEQRFFSVAVAVLDQEETAVHDGVATAREGAVKALQATLHDLGVRIDPFADRSFVATVLASASATDQALRAARCGLMMKLHLPHATVAVATGRGRMDGQLPIGEAVDRVLQVLDLHPAAREPGAAEPATTGVWLDTLTANLLSERLDVVDHDGSMELVGEQNPLARDGQRLLFGRPAPFVGREPALGSLESVLAVCIDDSVARAVGVVGLAGLGKSRLRHEFVRNATRKHPDLVVALGRGDLMHPGASYGCIRQALFSLCGLTGGESQAVQQRRIRDRLGLHLTGSPEANARVVHFLGEQCGVTFAADGDALLRAARRAPKVMLDQVARAFVEWIRCECKQAPVLLILEDLQWGDALSVQLVMQCLEEFAELPLCVLALGRPEVGELFPEFWSVRHIQEIPLRALSRRAAESMTTEVLGRVVGKAEAAVVARIVDRGAGHPLYLEELIRSVVEPDGFEPPETILAMLLARLSQLNVSARRALRIGSVFGETFSRAGVDALFGRDAAPGDLDATFAVLLRSECIELQPGARGVNKDRYKFHHALLRDAAYSLLSTDERRAAHRAVGLYLEQIGTVDPAVMAEHALLGDQPARAVRFFVDAATQALRRCDRALTERYAQRALDCGVTGEQRGIVRATQAWTCQARMDLGTAHALALEAVDSLPVGSFWWAKAIGICFYSFFMTDRDEHVDRLVAAFMTAVPAPDAGVAFQEAGIALSVFLTNAGRRIAAAAAISRITDSAVELDPNDHVHLLLADAYRTCKLEPDVDRACESARRALALVLDDGGSFLQVLAHLILGVSLTALGEVEVGEQTLRRGVAAALLARDAFGVVLSRLTLAEALIVQPDASKREEACRISADYIDVVQMGPAMCGRCHHIAGQALLIDGDLAGAEVAFQRALVDFVALPLSQLKVVPHLSALMLKQGRTAEARHRAEESLRWIDAQRGLGCCELPVRLAVALACEADGDREAATRALAVALVELQRRAARMADTGPRQGYLDIPTHVQIIALAAAVAVDM